jgi:hypothetical protein
MRTYHFNIIQGSEEWHDIRIGRIGGSEAAALLVNGKSAHELPPTTTALNVAEMMDYIAQVQQFAAEYLNVTIPEAGEQTELFT